MKKTISAILVCVLLVCSVFALASCGKKLSGTYENEILGLSYEFSGSNVTITKKNVIVKDVVIEGTYEIGENDDGDTVITITVESEEDDAEDLAGEYSFSEGEEDDAKYIKIGGIKYTKAD